MGRTNVTKTFLPPIEEYKKHLDGIWERGQLTNQGPLLLEFQDKVRPLAGGHDVHFVTNGTLAIQIALRALDVNGGEVITTPFSYVATVSALLWEGCKPVFVDIDPINFCIDSDKIEAAITKKTKAILAVHVFGYPCDVGRIESIAKKHDIKVIYDGAHAFGVNYGGKPLLAYGDISTCSFHATKLFHTIEGGAIVTPDKAVSDKVELLKRFGHDLDDHILLGINAKASEFQAAMGLCNLKYLTEIIRERRVASELYDKYLGQRFRRTIPSNVEYNFSYYPVVLENEAKVQEVLKKLAILDIYPRRYFYPSLNTLPYLKDTATCYASEDIARRVICLPLYPGIEEQIIKQISGVITR